LNPPTIIRIPVQSILQPVHVEVRRGRGSLEDRALLNGFPGALVRLRFAYDTLNAEYPFTWSPDILIDAWQTGDRISYHPETAREELATFSQKYETTLAYVKQEYDDVANLSETQIAEKLKKEHKYDERLGQEIERYRPSLARAITQLQDGLISQ